MPTSSVETWLRGLAFSLCATLAEAKYPFSSSSPKATLTNDTSVSFDPLGVAAVLGNPRAGASAAGLYVQYDIAVFHWPHMTMIGGTLPAMQMLVEHLTSALPSVHPAVRLCANETTMIPIRSNVSNQVFRELPLTLSNLWLHDYINFKPSNDNPGNDFMVICINTIDEDAKKQKHRMEEDPGLGWWMAGRLTLYLLILINGGMILAAMLIGILAADIWAFTLFFLYGSHWIASALITFVPMVKFQIPGNKIDENANTRYAAYQRPEGGTVIFKGRQDTLERWARSTWEYNTTPLKAVLHWTWMVTGALAAFASVACMVNMHGYLQLAFLAVLVYATLAEIIATKISRRLQIKAKGSVPWEATKNNGTRSQGIISATIAIRKDCRLEGFDWIQMGLLPNMPAFWQMQVTLEEINKRQNEEEERSTPHSPDEIEALQKELKGLSNTYVQKAIDASEEDKRKATSSLAERLRTEMDNAVQVWLETLKEKETAPVSSFSGLKSISF
ncbi:hypothetical protein ASPACDRAFT_61669 [Aspergillus aculeatus ATCC 16872]|uniref:Uncharacterized protein n=1 Tax=Aspergillus aculeatus (strain ATCC 16872 / CBS 172.66 / WB 5094) TaxID=690307 RepID=A0A1L9WSU7_ASPA1|nr:uncharacterized protein ASPACDRAFT_61669 [Aspergillus aculeatus ATCC 16872]OJJ98997.1 hypothetical protein ASPACDRAFT_61669 [Aspergillus aculeatus ATCC 16872]